MNLPSLTVVCRAEGVGTTIGQSALTLPILPLGSLSAFGCALSVSVILLLIFSSAVQKRWQGWQLPSFTFSPGYLFTLGWNFTLLVNLPLLLSLVCHAEKSWLRSLASGVCRPREWWTEVFFSPGGPFSLLNSSGVFYLSKGYGNRPLKLPLYPLTSPWAGLIIEDLWQIALNEFWALQQTGCCTVVLGHRGLLCLGLLPPACFGLTADAFCVGCFNLP